jgi:hypothetical protein
MREKSVISLCVKFRCPGSLEGAGSRMFCSTPKSVNSIICERNRIELKSPLPSFWDLVLSLRDARRDSRASDNNKVVAIVSGITVADHGRRTIEKLIDHAVSRNKLDSRAFSIEIEPIRLGNRGYHLAGFFDGHGRCAAQSGIFARQFLVAEPAVNLL